MVRPSSRSNARRSSLICTAITSGGGVLFDLIPCLQQLWFMFLQDASDFPQLGFTKTFVPTQLNRRQPEFGFTTGLVHVHMRWFIGLRTVETYAVTLFAQNGR